MVRAKFEVSVKVTGREGGVLKNLHCCFKGKLSLSSSFGKVFLSLDGTLSIQVKINLLGENCPGGIQDQSGLKDNLDKLAKELTGIKSKLDTQLPEIKSKLSKIESDVAGLQGGL